MAKPLHSAEIIQKLINEFGTQIKLGKAIGISQSTIAGWLRLEHGISELTALKIEKITNGKFRAVDLCPRLAELDK
ncbi:Putative antitoxin of toxin-antitoxin system, YdaS/YdaT [Moraxella cuniculi DSM 21768]|uniref:Putative antitoxin of toxin-antitoxin system, YdaS/YdaT n=1 Tax=Moraxella cuniculi DSM 21768 TaxID=1122245 RepID=A0A1N7DPB0_9GAMM|nr:Cro/CI family transcriptional regulator [Moraxella cuniculi]OOS05973.1 hypothetical protein B0189_05775 [Moraxella cuniculi]SIR77696.1 Putative antitoxin of toxin-antitoxin system, YdaS/YdaT [Moraxella cuniculi DSM 21768]